MNVSESDLPSSFGSRLATETRNIFAKLSTDNEQCDVGIVHDMKDFLIEQCGDYSGAEIKKKSLVSFKCYYRRNMNCILDRRVRNESHVRRRTRKLNAILSTVSIDRH